MLALNEALETLSKVDLRKGRVAELRYFGGLKMAKAWLLRELSGATRAVTR